MSAGISTVVVAYSVGQTRKIVESRKLFSRKTKKSNSPAAVSDEWQDEDGNGGSASSETKKRLNLNLNFVLSRDSFSGLAPK